MALPLVAGTTIVAQNLLGHAPLVDRLAVGIGIGVTVGVGALIAYLKPANPCGWLLGGAAAIAQVGIVAQDFAQDGVASPGEADGFVMASAWVSSWLPFVAGAMMLSLLLRFPTGAVLNRRWRAVEFMMIAAVVLAATSVAFMPGAMDAFPQLANPLGIDGLGDLLGITLSIAQGLVNIAALAVIGSLVVRYRRAGDTQRQQLKWVLFAVGVLAIALVFAGLVESAGALNEASFFLAVAGFTALPASIGVAILRHRLFDIDILINRTIVYAVMTAGVIGFYVAIVGTLTGVIGRNVDLGASLVATAVVAVAFNPVREGLQRLVNRVMFGRRDDPYAVVAQLGHELETVAAPQDVLPAIAEAVASSLRLPYVAIALDEGGERTVVAEHGAPEDHVEGFPLSHHGEKVGELTVRPRLGTRSLAGRDRELLEDLTRQIAPAAHAVRLNDALQRSRSSLVRARAEERRRLRRDLHDGLGPELAGIALGISAVQQEFEDDRETARRRLDKLDQQLRDAISNVRSIVAGLVPPELERLGLMGALRERSATFSGPGPMAVVVEGDIPRIEAAEELAAYRIALEAITNSARHSGATRCEVRVWLDDALHIEVTDDGNGIRADAPSGTGITSMRERAEEIGGSLRVEVRDPGGTVVHAVLPVSAR